MAGPMDGGLRVVSLWDSAEQFQAFQEERLHLTLDAGDGQPTVTLWEIEKVHRFD
jgi:heme-degrading monooxygenase HmoA